MIQDIQSNSDTRAVNINYVGIRQIKLPFTFTEKNNNTSCHSVATWTVATDLSEKRRGTHMSRLVRILHDNAKTLDFSEFCQLPPMLCEKLNAQYCFLSVEFPYFIEKKAPISEEKGFIDTVVKFIVSHTPQTKQQLLQVMTPVTSLCPCSKAISAYGAHNQRSHITLTIEPLTTLHPRDVVSLAEAGASCELFSILKRADERHVTERAYDNPKFVEDIARDLVVVLRQENTIKNYHIDVENYESIHNHSAHAIVHSDNFPLSLLTQ